MSDAGAVNATGPSRTWPPATFAGRLALVVAVAAMVRVIQALVIAPPLQFFADETFFKASAQLLGTGHGYIRPLDFFFHGQTIVTAEHPPLYPLALSALPAVGINGLGAARLVGVAFGTGTVVVLALIARRVAGDRAGLATGAICSLYPSFIAADGSIMSEPLACLLVSLAVLQALRVRARPKVGNAALLGGLIGLATLTRAEALLMLPLLGIPIVISAPACRLRTAAAVLIGASVVLTPWVARNWHVFGRPALGTDQGSSLIGSNCPATYYGGNIGSWDIGCTAVIPFASERNNEARWSAALSQRALDYVRAHAIRAVLVAAVRVARVWGLFQPRTQAHVTGRRVWVQEAGVAVYYLVAVLALIGVLRLRLPRIEKYILLTPVAVSTLISLLVNSGDARLRYEGEAALIVLAGIVVAEWSRSRRGGSGTLNAHLGQRF